MCHENSVTYVLNERVLTDDTLTIHADGTATVTYHTFASPYSDREHTATFATEQEADAFIVERYGKPWEQLVYGEDEE